MKPTSTSALTIEALAERHYSELRLIAHRMAGHLGIGDDLVQEAFLAAVRRFDRYDPTCSFVAWIRGIIRHRFLRYLYDKRRREIPFQTEAIELLGDGFGNDHEEGAQEERAHAARVVRECIRELPPGPRRILELFYFEQMPTGSIAERVGVSPGALRVQLHRGRIRLRQLLGTRLKNRGPRLAAA